MKAHPFSLRISSTVNGTMLVFWFFMLCTLVTPSWNVQAQQRLPFTNSITTTEVNLVPEKGSIWENGVGEGFRSTAYSFGLSAGATYGLSSLGSVQSHALSLTTLSYGHMLSPVWGDVHC